MYHKASPEVIWYDKNRDGTLGAYVPAEYVPGRLFPVSHAWSWRYISADFSWRDLQLASILIFEQYARKAGVSVSAGEASVYLDSSF